MASSKKKFGGILVIACYIIAVTVGFLAGTALVESGYSQIHGIIAADLVATMIVFVVSFLLKNSSFYDPFWSVIPIIIVTYLMIISQSGEWNDRKILAMVMIYWWGIRLTFNWWRGWKGLHRQDWRYDKLKDDTGKWYWLVGFLGIHLFPTLLVLLALSPFIPIFMEPQVDLWWLDWIGFGIITSAIAIEGIADWQLRRHVLSGSTQTLRTGIWKYSRHPNYFGEMSFWWGLFIVGYAANPDYKWTFIGALCIALLFFFISIPMMEKRMLSKRPDYAEIQKSVSMLIPWPQQKKE